MFARLHSRLLKVGWSLMSLFSTNLGLLNVWVKTSKGQLQRSQGQLLSVYVGFYLSGVLCCTSKKDGGIILRLSTAQTLEIFAHQIGLHNL